MTKKDALMTAIETLTTMDEMDETVETLKKMYDQLSVKRETSETVKQARHDATAARRAELIEKVAPVLRETFQKFEMPITVKELYEAAKGQLPEDFSDKKVQNILIREMAPELDKIDNGRGKPYTYQMKKA